MSVDLPHDRNKNELSFVWVTAGEKMKFANFIPEEGKKSATSSLHQDVACMKNHEIIQQLNATVAPSMEQFLTNVHLIESLINWLFAANPILGVRTVSCCT